MNILGINTATAQAAVAMIEGKQKPKTLFAESWLSNRDEAEKIVPAVASALKNNIPDAIFIVTGPGAFTGLRIGVTIANTLAFIYKAPVIGVSAYDFLRARLPEKISKKTALMLKAGGDFAAVLMPGKRTPERIHADDLKSFFRLNRQIRFLAGDMNPAERKKYPLPPGVVWLNEKSLKSFPQTVAHFTAKKTARHKIAEPRYLLPPKITQSKKPVFKP